MGLEIGFHCTPTFEDSWLCILLHPVVKSSPQILISDHHLSPMYLSPLLLLLLTQLQLICVFSP